MFLCNKKCEPSRCRSHLANRFLFRPSYLNFWQPWKRSKTWFRVLCFLVAKSCRSIDSTNELDLWFEVQNPQKSWWGMAQPSKVIMELSCVTDRRSPKFASGVYIKSSGRSPRYNGGATETWLYLLHEINFHSGKGPDIGACYCVAELCFKRLFCESITLQSLKQLKALKALTSLDATIRWRKLVSIRLTVLELQAAKRGAILLI